MTQLDNLNLVLIFEAFPILTFTDKYRGVDTTQALKKDKDNT